MLRTLILSAATLTAIPALAEVPAVVTDITPVESLVQQVMGDLGKPTMLMDQGADPHSYQLRPSQAGGLQDAGLVVWVGPAMTHWLADLVAGHSADSVLTLLEVPGTTLHELPPGGDEDGDTGTDPHAWLDPTNAAVWLDAIAARLGKLDPDNAAAYAANAATAKQSIAALDADLTAQLLPAQRVPLVFSHDAYGYFATHYHLTRLGAVAAGDAAAPGAARLSALQGKLTAGVCIFPEAMHDPKEIAVLTDGTAARIGRPLDPEGLAVTPGAGLYAQLLTDLAVSIADCASGR